MALRDYTRQELIGEGTYGKVYKAKHRVSGDVVALKHMKMHHGDAEGVPSTLIREASLLKELSTHPHVVSLKEACVEGSKLCLVFEWVTQDLKQLMDKTPGGLPLAQVKSLMFQLLRGIDYCHRKAVMHRDLKPQNILVDDKGILKLADFGLARSFSVPLKKYTHEVVTLWYRAPEVLLGTNIYTPGVDVWSCGAILGEMMNQKALWRETTELEELHRIFRSLGTPSEADWPGISALKFYRPTFPCWRPRPLSKLVPGLDEEGLDLLGRMLTFDPSKRITAKDAMRHPWFDEVDRSQFV